MSKKQDFTQLAVALGSVFALGATVSIPAQAGENPFSLTDLKGGYMVAEEKAADQTAPAEGEATKEKEGKCGEGKCGGEGKEKEGKCGEGKCGGEGKGKEGKCGEGKCGGEKPADKKEG